MKNPFPTAGDSISRQPHVTDRDLNWNPTSRLGVYGTTDGWPGSLFKSFYVEGIHVIPNGTDRVHSWNKHNWQALCKHHHDVKTRNEDHNHTYHY